MIFESQGKHRGNLRAYQKDYGTPVVFKAGGQQGFQIGEYIVFTFENDAIENKVFHVNAEDFTLSLKLTEDEADALYSGDVQGYIRIPYSAKRCSANYAERQSVEDSFLETVLNGFLYIDETVEFNGVLQEG